MITNRGAATHYVGCRELRSISNILRADPKSTKKTVKLSSFFALLGSLRVKAARRMLVKLTPDVRGDAN